MRVNKKVTPMKEQPPHEKKKKLSLKFRLDIQKKRQ